MSLNQNDVSCLFVSTDLDLVQMAAKTLKAFLPMTGFLDTEIAAAIKPTPKNRG